MKNRLQWKCAWKVSSLVIKYFSTFASEDSVENTEIKIIHCLYVCQKSEEWEHLFLLKNLSVFKVETEVEGKHPTKLMALKVLLQFAIQVHPQSGKVHVLIGYVNIKQYDCEQIEENCSASHSRFDSLLTNILSLLSQLALQRLVDKIHSSVLC